MFFKIYFLQMNVLKRNALNFTYFKRYIFTSPFLITGSKILNNNIHTYFSKYFYLWHRADKYFSQKTVCNFTGIRKKRKQNHLFQLTMLMSYLFTKESTATFQNHNKLIYFYCKLKRTMCIIIIILLYSMNSSLG